jgi:hypothetical protein
MSAKRNGFYQFSKWLPGYYRAEGAGNAVERIEDDLEPWIEHFDRLGIRTEVRQRVNKTKTGKTIQVALFREGTDPWAARENERRVYGSGKRGNSARRYKAEL